MWIISAGRAAACGHRLDCSRRRPIGGAEIDDAQPGAPSELLRDRTVPRRGHDRTGVGVVDDVVEFGLRMGRMQRNDNGTRVPAPQQRDDELATGIGENRDTGIGEVAPTITQRRGKACAPRHRAG